MPSLLDSIARAQTAVNHAKPFVKLMEALNDLAAELRTAGNVQKAAEESAKVKAGYDSAIAALEPEYTQLKARNAGLAKEITFKLAQCETDIDTLKKNAAAASADQEKAARAKLDALIGEKQKQVNAITATIGDLEKKRDDLAALVERLRGTVRDAHAAIG